MERRRQRPSTRARLAQSLLSGPGEPLKQQSRQTRLRSAGEGSREQHAPLSSYTDDEFDLP